MRNLPGNGINRLVVLGQFGKEVILRILIKSAHYWSGLLRLIWTLVVHLDLNLNLSFLKLGHHVFNQIVYLIV